MSKDALLAQEIVRNKSSNIDFDRVFHDSSFIYKKTNERLQDINYIFENKRVIACVIGSGDQIINSVLNKPRLIYAFDISVFPAYFLKLKLAAIKALSRDEFISFFFDDIIVSKDEYYDDLYFDKIREYLDDETKEFWDYLLNFNDWTDIYGSFLFSREVVSKDYAMIQNKYLDNLNYDSLKDLIDFVPITYEVSDIKNYVLPESQIDLVYLSNIIQYINPYEYNEILNRLVDGCDGEVVSYVFSDEDLFSDFLTSVDTDFKRIDSNSVLVHKKKHK